MRHTITRRQFLKAGGAAVVSTAAAGLLSSCGGSSASGSSTGGSGSSTYTLLYSRQPATLNYLICSADPDLYHGTQCVDTLVEYDNRGKIREGLATAWEWDADSLTWTFHLRDENWVDCNGEVLVTDLKLWWNADTLMLASAASCSTLRFSVYLFSIRFSTRLIRLK